MIVWMNHGIIVTDIGKSEEWVPDLRTSLYPVLGNRGWLFHFNAVLYLFHPLNVCGRPLMGTSGGWKLGASALSRTSWPEPASGCGLHANLEGFVLSWQIISWCCISCHSVMKQDSVFLSSRTWSNASLPPPPPPATTKTLSTYPDKVALMFSSQGQAYVLCSPPFSLGLNP